MKAVLLIALLMALAYTSFSTWRLSRQNVETQRQLEEQSVQLHKAEDTLKRVRARFQTDAGEIKQNIDHLRQSIKTEQDNLATLELDRNRARNGGVGGDDPARYADAIPRQTAVVQDLQNQLQQVQTQEKNLSASQKQALGNTREQQTAAQQQIAAAIQAGQQNLASLNAQIQALQPNRIDENVRDQITQLTQQVGAQKAQIEDLKNQRQQVNQASRGQAAGINTDAGAQLNDLRASENQLKQRVATEKAELDDLKRNQGSATQSRNSQKAAIDRVEKAYQSEKDKVADLKEQLKDQEERLKELTL